MALLCGLADCCGAAIPEFHLKADGFIRLISQSAFPILQDLFGQTILWTPRPDIQ